MSLDDVIEPYPLICSLTLVKSKLRDLTLLYYGDYYILIFTRAEQYEWTKYIFIFICKIKPYIKGLHASIQVHSRGHFGHLQTQNLFKAHGSCGHSRTLPNIKKHWSFPHLPLLCLAHCTRLSPPKSDTQKLHIHFHGFSYLSLTELALKPL